MNSVNNHTHITAHMMIYLGFMALPSSYHSITTVIHLLDTYIEYLYQKNIFTNASRDNYQMPFLIHLTML
jgi:hypothetical protein